MRASGQGIAGPVGGAAEAGGRGMETKVFVEPSPSPSQQESAFLFLYLSHQLQRPPCDGEEKMAECKEEQELKQEGEEEAESWPRVSPSCVSMYHHRSTTSQRLLHLLEQQQVLARMLKGARVSVSSSAVLEEDASASSPVSSPHGMDIEKENGDDDERRSSARRSINLYERYGSLVMCRDAGAFEDLIGYSANLSLH